MGFIAKLREKKMQKKLDKGDEAKKVLKGKVSEIEKAADTSKKESKFKKWIKGLFKSKKNIDDKFAKLLKKNKVINDEFFDDLEEMLILADLGVAMTGKVIELTKKKIVKNKVKDPQIAMDFVVEAMFNLYNEGMAPTDLRYVADELNIYLVIGVNGVGKTTSIAKIAKRLHDEGKKVVLAAADTFRAGAVEQLRVWSERLGVTIVTPAKEKQDPSSVVFDALVKAKAMGADVLICDTAGRLENKAHLMQELEKMYKVIRREVPTAPHETLLVLDATVGQNGVNQARQFNEITKLTGIVLTKMDGTSKGGIVFAIKASFGIPVKFIGLGEQLDDLEIFDIENYVLSITDGLNATETEFIDD